MRILHTSDFHAGRSLRGFDRTPEIRDALLEIADIARSEKVDAVLVAGDIFDSQSPSAEAEAVVFEFFLKLHEYGIPSISIAGNHDNSSRLSNLSSLFKHINADLVARVTADASQMVRHLQTKNGETLLVGAMPFLSERRIVKAAELLNQDASQWKNKYRDGMRFFLSQIGESLSSHSNCARIIMAHATVDGAIIGGSERHLDITSTYTVSGAQFPAGVHYVALGHIHKPQKIIDSPLGYYSGSIIQLDFGESGEKKYVNIIDIDPTTQKMNVEHVALVSGKELRTIHVDIDDIDQRLEREKGFSGLLKVLVKADANTIMPGLKDRVLRITPNAIGVDLVPIESELETPTTSRKGFSLQDLYTRFWKERHGELPDNILQAFNEADEAAKQEDNEE